jgi:transposase
LPPDTREWLPEDHLAWLVLEIVEQLDRSALHARHPNSGAGRAAYDPDMLLALLIYAYCQGVRSSRQIEQRCVTDVAFRVLCAQDVPDHTTIARFRVDHQEVFAGLFTQVLQIAAAAGMARFGTVAIDGTKIPANASADANRHRDWLVGEVDALLRDATQLDATEDAEHAQDPSDEGDGDGQRMPASLRGSRWARRAAARSAGRDHRPRTRRASGPTAAAGQRGTAAGTRPGRRVGGGAHPARAASAGRGPRASGPGGSRQQAKLDRRAALIAAGRRPMGRPPFPVEQPSRAARPTRC